MATFGQAVGRHPIARHIGMMFVAVLAGFALAQCGGEPAGQHDEGDEGSEGAEIETMSQELSDAQCKFFTNNGKNKTKICVCDSKGKNCKPKDVNQSECCKATSGSKNYIATGDPTCKGGGCVPVGAPCDKTLKCCSGSTCTNGKCVATCIPGGGACTIAGAANCCSKVCSIVANSFACTGP